MNQPTIDILIVDDDEVDREIMRRFLPDHYHVREASLGLAALSLVKAHRPDCILLDWFLTDIEGQKLVHRFSKIGIPVIVLTGVPKAQIVLEAMQQGAQDFLLKDDLSRGILVQAITDAIGAAVEPQQEETVSLAAKVA